MTERTFEGSDAVDRIEVTQITQRSRSDCELAAQAFQPEPDAALGGPERDVRPLRDLVGGEAAPVGEHDRLALGLGKLAERLSDLGVLLAALDEHGRVLLEPRLVVAG